MKKLLIPTAAEEEEEEETVNNNNNNNNNNNVIVIEDDLSNMMANNKKQRTNNDSNETKYIDTKILCPTSNCVERLFSRAKLTFSPLRKRMNPEHLEAILYLLYNKDLWSASTVARVEAGIENLIGKWEINDVNDDGNDEV